MCRRRGNLSREQNLMILDAFQVSFRVQIGLFLDQADG